MSKMDKMQMILDLNTQLQLSYPPNKKMKECWTPETMVLPNSQLPMLPSAPADSWLSPNLLRPFYSIQDNMREFWYPNKDDGEPPLMPPQSSNAKPPPQDPYKKRMVLLLIVGICLLIIIFAMVVLIYVQYTKHDNNTDENLSSKSGNQSNQFTNSIDNNTKKDKDQINFDDYKQLLVLQYKNLTDDVKKLQGEVEKYKSEVKDLQQLYNQCKKREESTVQKYITTLKPQKDKDKDVPFYNTSKPPKNLEQDGKEPPTTNERESVNTISTTERASIADQDTNMKIAHNNGRRIDDAITPFTPLPTTTVNSIETSKPTNLESVTEINGNINDQIEKELTTKSTLGGDVNNERPNNPNQDDNLSRKNENKDNGTEKGKNNTDNGVRTDSDSKININDKDQKSVTEKYQHSYKFSTPISIETTTSFLLSTTSGYHAVTESENELGNVVSENVVLPTKIPKIQDQTLIKTENKDGDQTNQKNEPKPLKNDTAKQLPESSPDNSKNKNAEEPEKQNDRKGRDIPPIDSRNQTNHSPENNHKQTTVPPNNQETSGDGNNRGDNNSNNSVIDDLSKQDENLKSKTADLNINDGNENPLKPTNGNNDQGLDNNEKEYADGSVSGDNANNNNNNNQDTGENETKMNDMRNKTDSINGTDNNESNKMNDKNPPGEQSKAKDKSKNNTTDVNKTEVSQNGTNKDENGNTLNKPENGNGKSERENKEMNPDGKGKSGNSSDLNDMTTGDKIGKDKTQIGKDGKKNEDVDPPQKNGNISYEKPRKKGKGKDNEPLEKDNEKDETVRNKKKDHKHNSDEQNSHEDDEDTDSDESSSEEEAEGDKELSKNKENHNKKGEKKDKLQPPPKKDERQEKHKPKENGTRKPTHNEGDKTSHKKDDSEVQGNGSEIKMPSQNITEDENRFTAHWNHYKETNKDKSCNFRTNLMFPFSHLNNSCYLNYTGCQNPNNEKPNEKLQLKNTIQYDTMCILLLLDTGKDPTTAIIPNGNSNYILSVAGNHTGSFSVLLCVGESILLQVEIAEIGNEGDLARMIFTTNIKKNNKRSRHRIYSEEVHPVKIKRRGGFAIVIFSGKEYYNVYVNNFGGSPVKYKHRMKEDNAVRVKFRGAVTVSVLTFEIFKN